VALDVTQRLVGPLRYLVQVYKTSAPISIVFLHEVVCQFCRTGGGKDKEWSLPQVGTLLHYQIWTKSHQEPGMMKGQYTILHGCLMCAANTCEARQIRGLQRYIVSLYLLPSPIPKHFAANSLFGSGSRKNLR
jgi:hypothetical protein